jgi:hypothetical protein
MNEPYEGQTDAERGAAEDTSGVPVTPTEEEASRKPPSDPGDQDAETPGSGTAQSEDLNPDDLE